MLLHQLRGERGVLLPEGVEDRFVDLHRLAQELFGAGEVVLPFHVPPAFLFHDLQKAQLGLLDDCILSGFSDEEVKRLVVFDEILVTRGVRGLLHVGKHGLGSRSPAPSVPSLIEERI